MRSLEVGEPLPGTAPTALTWVVVEHDGPWGRDALRDAALSDRARSALLGIKGAGTGVLLARRPEGRRHRRDTRPGHDLLIARTAPGGCILRRGHVVDIAELSAWDAEAVAEGRLPASTTASSTPVLLVCTQGRRDPCCAVHGRALAAALLDAQAARTTGTDDVEVWECSHIGGHRLAPVTLSLPSGAVHGRLSPEQADQVLDSLTTGTVLLDHLRGRTALPAPCQAVDVATRLAIGEPAAGAIDVLLVTSDRAIVLPHDWRATADVVELEARHADGRAWRARARRVSTGITRPESCEAEPAELVTWQVQDLEPTRAWR